MYTYTCIYTYIYTCIHICIYTCMYTYEYVQIHVPMATSMGWLRLVGSLKLQVSFAKEPYKRDYVLQKRPIILRRLLIVATPYLYLCKCIMNIYTHRYIYTNIFVCIHICICTCICIFTCIHTYYIYIHAYAYIHM